VEEKDLKTGLYIELTPHEMSVVHFGKMMELCTLQTMAGKSHVFLFTEKEDFEEAINLITAGDLK